MDSVADKMIAARPYVKNYWSNGDDLLEMVRSGEVTAAMGWDQRQVEAPCGKSTYRLCRPEKRRFELDRHLHHPG